MSTTLLQIRDDVRQLADDVNKVLIGDTELTRMVNQSGSVWHIMLVQSLPELFEKTETITPDNNVARALPTDHYKTIGVRYNDSSGNSRPLRRIMYHERWRYSQSTTNEAIAYYVQNLNMNLLPPPATGSQTYTHDYIQSWIVLTADADTIMGVADGRHDFLDSLIPWIVADVAIKLARKEGMPINELLAMKEDVERIINAAIQDRDSGSPERVVDVRTPYQFGSGVEWDPDFWSNR